MRYTTLDTIAVAIVAIVAGVQYLRGKDNLSQIVYESAGFCAAAFGANKLYLLAHQLTKFSFGVSFLLCFLVLAALAVFLSALLNGWVPFDFGAFNYLLAFFFAVIAAYAFGHGAMRTFEYGFVMRSPELMEAMTRSWVARELLYFRTAKEILVFLRFVRWKDM